jgi:hypothetical protein
MLRRPERKAGGSDLDRESLPKVKMPLGEGEHADLPEWKPKTRRLKGYPF